MANTIPALPSLLTTKTQESFKAFLFQCYSQYNQNWNIRTQMREIDLAYQREADLTEEQRKARAANRKGDKTKFQNITVPIILPQVEAAVTYQSSVFLTGTPLLGVGASPKFEDEALQLETVIDQQAIKGGWTAEFTKFFRDGFKYNISALEVTWDREITYAPETDLSNINNPSKLKEVLWEGNSVRRWDMYNTFFDTRVAPVDIPRKGEFAGNIELMSRVMLKQFIASLPNVRVENIKLAFESSSVAINVADSSNAMMSYYIPQINPRTFINPILTGQMDWNAWAGLAGANTSIRYNNMYQVTTIYARIIPSDFGIRGSNANTVQIWKLIFVNHSVLIYAERQTNAHTLIPVLIGQPYDDGLGLQTKSLADNVSPIQDITSALSNSQIAARRRAVSDRTLYDPSRVTEAQINNPNPSAKIPVRPAAYGKPLGEAVYPFPFRDDQYQYVDLEIKSYAAMANMISGQNPVRQGQFVKGNKTQSEFDSVMNNANGRDQLTAISYESQIFTPLKEILKINILQYQGGISLYSRDKKEEVAIDPVALRKAVLEFKVSDGLIPTDKLLDSDTNMVALQMIGTSPAIGAAYNIAPLFSYLMKTKGADITDFEKSPAQQAYEQAASQYQQMIMQLYKQNPEQDPSKLPPAPLPQNYGYVPSSGTGQDTSQSAGSGQSPDAAPNNPVSSALAPLSPQ